jgi:hypothetical protein
MDRTSLSHLPATAPAPGGREPWETDADPDGFVRSDLARHMIRWPYQHGDDIPYLLPPATPGLHRFNHARTAVLPGVPLSERPKYPNGSRVRHDEYRQELIARSSERVTDQQLAGPADLAQAA